MQPATAQRIALDLAILASIFLLPWWVVLALVLAALFVLRAYETAAAGLFLDILYAANPERFGGFEFVYTTLFLLLLGASLLVRKYIQKS